MVAEPGREKVKKKKQEEFEAINALNCKKKKAYSCNALCIPFFFFWILEYLSWLISFYMKA